MAQQVRQIMTDAPIAVSPKTPATEVAQLMRREDIGAVLVVEKDQLRGLVTDRDLVVRLLADGGSLDGRGAGEVCSHQLHTVRPDEDVDRAMEMMRERAVRRLPVVEDGQAVGIVSLGDMVMAQDPQSVLSDISGAEPSH
jgi:CBS domain-containing protein